MNLPNVVLISLDAVRADRLGCYGYGRDTSPTIDGLAADALLCEAAYSASDWTLPSHVSMMTGLPVSRHGVGAGARSTRRMTSLYWRTLPEMLRDAGHYTVGWTNCAYLSRATGFDRGFESLQWVEELFESDHPVVSHRVAGRFWGRRLNALYRDRVYRRRDLGGRATLGRFRRWLCHGWDREAPFFAFVHLMEGHAPYTVPASHRDRFREDGVGEVDWIHDHISPWNHLSGARRLSDDRLATLGDLYDGALSYVDELLAGFVEALEESAGLDDTILIVTADHGEYLGEHGAIGHAGSGLHEPVIRIPLIIRGPGVAPGRATEVAGHLDLVPTILELLGLGSLVPPDGHGRCLAGASAADGGSRAVSESLADPRTRLRALGLPVDESLPPWIRVVRRGSMKLVVDGNSAARLFDLSSDPGESNDVAAEHPDIVDDLMTSVQELQAHAARSDDASREPAALADDVRRKLRALGYVE